MTQKIPKRFPPPLGRVTMGKDGIVHPVIEGRVFIPECGQQVRLRGVGLVQCIRRKGHPVYINYGHSNGYEEWCFEEGDDA